MRNGNIRGEDADLGKMLQGPLIRTVLYLGNILAMKDFCYYEIDIENSHIATEAFTASFSLLQSFVQQWLIIYRLVFFDKNL